MISGSGSGSGSGDGYGYGSGSGDGYGYGSGSGSWSLLVEAASKSLPANASAIALWRSTADGQSANGGGRIEPAAPGVIHESPGPLSLCKPGTLHATVEPEKRKGDRLWVVALYGEIVREDDKYGALKREILWEL